MTNEPDRPDPGRSRPSSRAASRADKRGGEPADDQPVLPAITDDERGLGWGEDPESGRRDEDWYRRERPPHHE